MREGKGIQYFTDGSVVEGYFQADQFVKGRLIDVNGNILTGSFQNNKLTGTGDLKSNALNYQGDFKDGDLSGKGSFTWVKNEFQLKFAGICQDNTFLSGKFEVK